MRALHLDFPKKVTVPDHVEKIVFFNLFPNREKKCDLSKLPKEKMVAFLWEPPSVIPRLYESSFLACFSKIYTWDDSLLNEDRFFKFNYPVFREISPDLPSFEEKKLCTVVCSNLKSSHENELYSERRKAIDYFESCEEEGFMFYGRGWDPNQFKRYRGAVEDKVETLKQYRFTLCYENISQIQGYITEKIFDCFAAGSVPIYWGAANIADYIPKGCFIDRREFTSLKELHTFLKEMTEEEYAGHLKEITAFLQSDSAKAFSWDQFGDAFYAAVTSPR